MVRTTLAGGRPARVRERTARSTSRPQLPSNSLAVKFGGRRVAQRVSVTSASWRRNWVAEMPPPTTRVRSPRKSSTPRNWAVWSCRPSNSAMPGTKGT
ncbi:Uncharacterised protein [Mycobacteroides abscessus subsp. abscessus]|nr:Uncharacterised protein [Mycobacteroides abscessus subsp. abscessus]